jgi:thiosulfate reductase cytochrome b subunit
MTMIREQVIYRHTAIVRLTHWVNVVCLTVLLMSGLQIFNAHPALYVGKQSDFDHPVLSIAADRRDDVGIVTILGQRFTTTGVLGVSKAGGEQVVRAFPSWATLPSGQDLATARRWHFLFAWIFVLNGAVYLISSLASGHVRRDLLPSLAALGSLPRSLLDHIRLRFPRGEEARRYNVVQQLTYLAVIFGLLPIAVVTGLAMSPGLDALFHPMVDLLGGRQSARTVHFVAAAAIVMFVVVHVAMVLVSGVFNNMRSMITGRYDLGEENAHGRH